MRWTDRAIGLLSTIILARLLVPEDFGVVAMATMAIGLAAVFLDLGVNIALIQNPNATQAHYNAAFTLRVIQTACLALLMWFGAPLAADYFNDARVTPVLRWLALGIVIGGFENVGVITFQKEMRFGQEFKIAFLRRFMAFVTVVTAAWFLRSYWALVIGTLAGQVLGVGLSYLAHPMRPRFSTQKIGEIFSVSQWVLVRGVGAYLDNNLHRILVGRRASAATLGAYTLADEISAMPSSELLAPLNRVLFPGFVRAKEQPGELKRLFLLAQGLQTAVGVPAAVGLMLVAPEAVAVLLGERWAAAAPFVQLLAFGGAVQALTTSGSYVMITLGEVRKVALLAWFRVVLFALVALLIFPASGAISLAWMRIATVFAGLALSVWLLLGTFKELQVRELFASVWRPALAVLLMAFCVDAVSVQEEWGVLGALAAKVAVGLLA